MKSNKKNVATRANFFTCNSGNIFNLMKPLSLNEFGDGSNYSD